VTSHPHAGPSRSVDGGIDEIPLPDGIDGRLFLCGKHVVGPDPEAALARVGGTSIVCLNQRSELEARYPGYVAWLREHGGGRAVWAPIHDLGAPQVHVAEALVTDVVGRLQAGETVVMHCGAGIGRAGTMAVAVLHRLGNSVEDAGRTVRAHRPMAGPEAGAQSELLEALDALRAGNDHG
jgi:protein-tyrosine phosphatase